MADTESPLEKFKNVVRSVVKDVLTEHEAEKTKNAPPADDKTKTTTGNDSANGEGDKPKDWLTGLFGG